MINAIILAMISLLAVEMKANSVSDFIGSKCRLSDIKTIMGGSDYTVETFYANSIEVKQAGKF